MASGGSEPSLYRISPNSIKCNVLVRGFTEHMLLREVMESVRFANTITSSIKRTHALLFGKRTMRGGAYLIVQLVESFRLML